MPRKVDSRLGEDGFDVGPQDHLPSIDKLEAFICRPDGYWEFSPTLEQIDRLLVDQGISVNPCQLKYARDTIEDIGVTYWNWHHRGASAFTRAQAHKALEAILKGPRLTFAVLEALNDRAFEGLLHELSITKPRPAEPDKTVLQTLIENRIEEDVIRAAITRAIGKLKAQKGADHIHGAELAWHAEHLGGLYEVLTGRRMTHSSKTPKTEGRGHSQGPRSAAGRFASTCLNLIDPRIATTEINTAMRRAIALRRAARRRRT